MDNQTEYINALINLHCGLNRQGPGDDEFSRFILSQLPVLPPKPRIADLGCGTGVATLLLAKYYHSQVIAVDFSSDFIQELEIKAKQAGLEDLITAIHGDMAKLDWPPASVDLLWSEGAIYNLGFKDGLQLWYPLISPHGIAVISEMSWFLEDVPEPVTQYWQASYPTMGTEAENIETATRCGFKVLATYKLPSHCWWYNYYQPVRERFKEIESTPINQSVISEMEEEMRLFESFSDFYGYTFYVLQKGVK
ncbi:MAG: methyltransferase domain-containing protein [Sphaerospermopsis sp. SIO1G1]|nr:methyltransferase domain-containing protein [Sphaerospermopsis sp. SIO1G1]